MNQNIRPASFTIDYGRSSNVIFTEVRIHNPIPETLHHLEPNTVVKTYNAIWDTGATNTVITQRVASELKFVPSGKTMSNGIHGPQSVNTYFIGIRLPNEVGIKSLKVTECNSLNGPFDVLIGMDVISLGDFSISNFNGKTTFSFRYPSCEMTDYVKDLPKLKPIVRGNKQLPNERCKCGSGKKYKNCCGR